MSKEMVISANPHETRVAIMEEGQLCEYYVERQKEFALVGSIYKGRVTRVLPGMQSAFVEIGLDSDAFLYVRDFLEETEELDHIVTTVVDKVEKMEEQGGHVFATENPSAPALEPADVERAPAAFTPESHHEEALAGGEGEHEAEHAGEAQAFAPAPPAMARPAAAPPKRSQRCQCSAGSPTLSKGGTRRQPRFWTPRWRRRRARRTLQSPWRTRGGGNRFGAGTRTAAFQVCIARALPKTAGRGGAAGRICADHSAGRIAREVSREASGGRAGAARRQPLPNEETHSPYAPAAAPEPEPMQEHSRRLRFRSSHARISRTRNLAHRHRARNIVHRRLHWAAGSSRCPARRFRNGSAHEPRCRADAADRRVHSRARGSASCAAARGTRRKDAPSV